MTKKNLVFLAAIFTISAAIYTLTARALSFHVILNDFWTVFYYARHLTQSVPASLQNSLFPIGYATVLHLIPVRYALWMAFYLNVGLASLAVAGASALALTGNNFWRAALVGLVAIFYPLAFRYANTSGPDLGVATFIAWGLFFLWKNDLAVSQPPPNFKEHRIWERSGDLLAGACLGLASLWRSHAIVAGVAILLAYTVVMGVKALWQRKSLWVAFLLVAGLQALVNLISGHGLLENAQYFNIYKTFFGNDWLAVPTQASDSLLSRLFSNPGALVAEYAPHVWGVLVYAWPAVPLFFVSREKSIRRWAVFSGLAILFYSIPVAFGSSPRAPIAILPLAFVTFGFLISKSLARLSGKRPVLIAALTLCALAMAWFGWQWYETNTRMIHDFSNRHERYLRIERKLRMQGLTSPDQVFTNSYNFYLPVTSPHYPRSNGGWDVTVTWNFRAEYPELPLATWDEFAAACRAQGIRFLVLTPYSYELAPYFGELYQGTFIPEEVDTLGFDGDFQLIVFK
ncbi:MAG: hypothetical protein RBS68_11195 [Anaerolineales bacterium]|jgi:hypothetical protein|nr:hypothetical protein [Anaerolineales bacterium]